MINSSERFFQSNQTREIDNLIKQVKPTREMQFSKITVADAIGVSADYRSTQPIQSYLESLVRKKLLTAYGSNDAASVMTRIYYIDSSQPHQQAYWENLK